MLKKYLPRCEQVHFQMFSCVTEHSHLKYVRIMCPKVQNYNSKCFFQSCTVVVPEVLHSYVPLGFKCNAVHVQKQKIFSKFLS